MKINVNIKQWLYCFFPYVADDLADIHDQLLIHEKSKKFEWDKDYLVGADNKKFGKPGEELNTTEDSVVLAKAPTMINVRNDPKSGVLFIFDMTEAKASFRELLRGEESRWVDSFRHICGGYMLTYIVLIDFWAKSTT